MIRKCLLLLFVSFATMACTPEPSVRLLESLKAIEIVMQDNATQPELLVVELESCIKKHQDIWAELIQKFDGYSEDQLMRELGARESELRIVMTHILDLDLEIQDRIANQPELRDRYLAAIRSIGR